MAHLIRAVRNGVIGHLHLVTGRFLPIMAGAETATIDDLRARQDSIRLRLSEIDREFEGRGFPDDVSEEWNRLNEEYDDNTGLIDQLSARAERIRSIGGEDGSDPTTSSRSVERPQRFNTTRGGDPWDLAQTRSALSSENGGRLLRDQALRAVEASTFPHEGVDEARAREHIERLLDGGDLDDRGMALNRTQVIARHIIATGSPLYRRAFARAVSSKPLTTEEHRALSLADSAGGFAVPFQLDPTIIPTSNGSVNPYRQLGRVVTIAGTDEWRGVSSSGVRATRVAAGTEATDDAPSLKQPRQTVQRVQAFIPFDIEIGMDWGQMAPEMAVLLQDAKDDEEVDSFTHGDGEAPRAQGILAFARRTVEFSGTASFSKRDLYAMEQALPPRFRPRAQWVGSRSIYNLARDFSEGSDVWVEMREGLANNPGGNTGARLLGYPANEASAMPGEVRAGAQVLILGDWRYFVIVDRIGMTIELVQHLVGTNHRPTGQRGFYAYWRNNSVVVDDNAFRVGVVGDGA